MILTKEKSAILGTKNGTGEGVACLKRWYVAHVRIHHEKKVAEYLGKMGIETFVPVQQEIHQWSDRRKLVETVSSDDGVCSCRSEGTDGCFNSCHGKPLHGVAW